MFGTPTQVGTIAGATVKAGPSGMVASRAHPGVLYAQMDTGGPATVFAMTTAGASLGEYTLTGVTQTDWEDIAVGPGAGGGSFIFVGDIGDNSANRTQVQVYRFAEPNVSLTQAPAQTAIADAQELRFTYPDGAHNAETLMVDPRTGDILILTKDSSGNSSVFSAPGNTAANTPTALTRVAMVQFSGSGQGVQAGGGDISPDGDRVIVRTYTAIYLWPRAATWMATFSAMPRTLPSPTEPQSEGLTFSADGRAWLSAGEQAANIYQASATCP